MTTLRREAIQKVFNLLELAYQDNPPTEESRQYNKEQAEKIADEVLAMRAFKRGSEEWKEQKGAELAEKSVEAAVYSGQKVSSRLTDKNREAFELDDMIDKQLARLPLNWTGFTDKEQENFRKFLKKERKENGRELEAWVNWWMSDEWRVSNPPWKLNTIKIKWLDAFKGKSVSKAEIEVDDNDVPMTY